MPDDKTPQGATEAPAGISAEAVEKLVNDKVNAALTTHLTRFKGSFAKDVEGMLGNAIKPLAEQFAAFQRPTDPAAGATAEELPEVKAMKQALAKQQVETDKLAKQVQASEAARESERATRLDGERRVALRQKLGDKGVTGAHLKAAEALLYDAEKRVLHDDKIGIGMKVMRPYGEEIVTLDEALDEWLKTDDGKAFLPPRGAQGSGTIPGRPAARRSGPPTREEAKAEARQQLRAILGQR